MVNNSTLSSPNCKNFVAKSKQFTHSGMGTMENIVALKYHSPSMYVHNTRPHGQLEDKVFVFKMCVDLLSSGVNLGSEYNLEVAWAMHGLSFIMLNSRATK
jgi:hypothetical protein